MNNEAFSEPMNICPQHCCPYCNPPRCPCCGRPWYYTAPTYPWYPTFTCTVSSGSELPSGTIINMENK